MRRSIVLLAATSVALTIGACAESSPEEQVAEARARYSVTLNGFFVKEEPPVVDEADAEGEVAEASSSAVASAEEGADVEGEEEMEMEMDEGPRPVDVLLDLIVQHDLDEALPGITVDLVMVDPDRNEKDSWRIWIETAGLPEANQKQVTHVLEDVMFEEGDGFSVEIRSPVPASEYGEYREFADAG